MSLSSLPTELVRQIIESSIPSTFHSTTYDERQTILHSLCLVSRQLQQIAQPLLREVVSFATTRRLVADLDLLDTEVFYNSVRHFAAMVGNTPDSNSESIRRFIVNARHLRNLVLDRYGYGSVDLSILSSVSNLSTLQLTGGTFTLLQPAPLPNLNCLIVNDEALPVALPFLDPTFLPNLTHLSLPKVYGDLDHALLQRSKFSALLPQLRSLNVYWRLALSQPDYPTECTDRTLFDCNLFDFLEFTNSFIKVRHLRILDLMRTPQNHLLFLMDRLIRWVDAQRQNNLHSLYVDSSLNPFEDVSPGFATPMEKLLQSCEDKKVEVVFERQLSESVVDMAHSEEFCRRQREIRT